MVGFSSGRPRTHNARRRPLAAIPILVALLACLGPAGAQETPRRGGTIILGVESDPMTLNYYVTPGAETGTVANHIFDQLIETDLSFTLKPRLAERWEVSPDGKSYTFHLFKNAMWHDGKPVTSEDVKWSILEAATKYHPRLGTLFRGSVEDVLTPDPHTAVMQLRESFAPMLSILAAGGGPVILPKHVYGDGQDFKSHPAHLKPVGSGPFKFKQWVKGSHLELERNERYHKPGIPYLDRVVIQFLPDVNSRWIALEKGEVDYLHFYIMPVDQVARAKATPNLVVEERGGEGIGSVEFMIMNTRSPFLGKREVRQALAYAIDRKALVEKAFQGLGKPALSIMSSGIKPMFNSRVPVYERDLQKAHQLLDAAGFPRKADGRRFRLKLLRATGRDVETSVAEVIRDQLREVGVDVELLKMDRAAAIDQVYIQWNFDAALWILSTGPDPTQQITRSYHTQQIKKVAFTNASGYSNPETDALFDAEFKQVDPNERVRMWHRIQEILMRDVPVLPLVEMPVANVYNKRFRDVVTHPFQNMPYVGHAWSTQAAGSGGLGGMSATTVAVVGAAVAAVVLAGGFLIVRRRRAA